MDAAPYRPHARLICQLCPVIGSSHGGTRPIETSYRSLSPRRTVVTDDIRGDIIGDLLLSTCVIPVLTVSAISATGQLGLGQLHGEHEPPDTVSRDERYSPQDDLALARIRLQ